MKCSTQIPVPMLTNTNYLGWSFEMRVLLDYHGLLSVVEQGVPPITKKATQAQKDAHVELENKDSKALHFIHQGVRIDDIFDKIADATTSKQAWDHTLKHLEKMIPNMLSPKPQRVKDPEYLASYNKAFAYLSAPECSSTLLYQPHLVTLTNNKTAAAAAAAATNSKPPPKSKKPTPKKIRDKFLANAKTLTVTGMLDGVAVRYVSKTKKLELCGKIQGPSYLCGCQSCNYSKTINAYEFEIHAGNKTSHPNNHIHFENGNSVHMVVMELNRTPESNLFDALHTLTGSSIDQKAFSVWKGSI